MVVAALPVPPPNVHGILAQLPGDRLLQVITGEWMDDRYLPWDELRRRPAPVGFSHEEWWAGIKSVRLSQRRDLPFVDAKGKHFSFTLPDSLLAALDEISRLGGGQVNVPELVVDGTTRDRYLVNSLMEEAITSSQLEGAVTTRKIAKDMLRSGRSPRDRSEQMIVNNFAAMRFVREHLDEPITPDRVLELHEIVTERTLDNPRDAGRLQLPGEERVGVWSEVDDELVHDPPPAEELPARLDLLCSFANGEVTTPWMHGALRAIIVHFIVGHDHYFVDGNGRTARALFYWVALKNGLWLLEFTAISSILRNAPTKYARSYLHTEQDDGDVTYFALHQVDVIRRAIDQLHEYLDRKSREAVEMRDLVAGLGLNHRQTAIVERAVRDPALRVTVRSHAASHRVTPATARTDLVRLEAEGLLVSTMVSRARVWTPAKTIREALGKAGQGQRPCCVAQPKYFAAEVNRPIS